MKRMQLLKLMRKYGAVFIRHGNKHDIYENPRTHEFTQVPRHPTINKHTAQDILNKLSK
jgi:predicted RNA binding protein YcfA (HicA-like mRNA interferase family)